MWRGNHDRGSSEPERLTRAGFLARAVIALSTVGPENRKKLVRLVTGEVLKQGERPAATANGGMQRSLAVRRGLSILVGGAQVAQQYG